MENNRRENEILSSEYDDIKTGRFENCSRNRIASFLRENLMLILTFSGVAVGFSLGFAIQRTHPSKDALMWIGMPGELFLRIIKLLILPLIVCSVISGLASLDPRSNGKISGISLLYCLLTNTLASLLGVILCLILKPGAGDVLVSEAKETALIETQDIFADLLRNIFPDNLIKATLSQYQTVNTVSKHEVLRNTTNGTVVESVLRIEKSSQEAGGTNVLGLIIVCTCVGIASSRLKKKTETFIAFFAGCTEVILQILRWFLWTSPIGIASLIAASIGSMEEVVSVFEQIGLVVITVTLGVAIQQLIILPFVLFVFTRRNPYVYLINLARPWMVVFAVTSTAVAIPEMLTACEEKNKIDKRITRFVIPFCTTVNANGSAFYIATAAIFIANITGTQLSAANYIVICILTGMASLALPSIPSSALVVLVMVLTSLNIPAGQISLLFAVEWYLDRIRSTSNMVSHTICAAITYKLCKSDLKNIDVPCEDMEIEIHNPESTTELSKFI